MNKVILSVVILAGVVCLTDAACNQASAQTCTATAQAAAAKIGTNVKNLCPILKTFENCVKSAGCPVSQVQSIINALEKAAGLQCGSSVAKVSVAAMLLALVASYLWK